MLLAEVVQRSDTSGYVSVAGLAPRATRLRRISARTYGAAGLAVHADDVMVTTGCNQAFCLAIGALCSPGDEVLLPTPYYFNHHMWLRACGITPVPLALSAERGMVPDPATVEQSITASYRAPSCLSPRTTRAASRILPDLVEAVFDVAERHQSVALILDETYKDFRTTTDPPHHLFQRRDWRDTLVHLYSFSKMLSLAGYRAGSLVAAPHVLDAAAKLADCETIGAPRVAQEAVAFGLSPALEPWVEDRRRAMCERAEHLGTARCQHRLWVASRWSPRARSSPTCATPSRRRAPLRSPADSQSSTNPPVHHPRRRAWCRSGALPASGVRQRRPRRHHRRGRPPRSSRPRLSGNWLW